MFLSFDDDILALKSKLIFASEKLEKFILDVLYHRKITCLDMFYV